VGGETARNSGSNNYKRNDTKKADVANATDPASIPFIKVKDISEGGEIIRNSLDYIAQSIHEGPLKRSILRADDLLYSIAGTIGRISIVDRDLDNSNCNQAIGFIRLKSPELHLSLCWETLHSDRVKDFISSQVVQAVQANASLTNLRQIQVVVPGAEILAQWNTLANPYLTQRRELAIQSRALAELRDTLLPKLLSGELSVGEGSEAVKAVSG
jgi:type I restriction enzyme S subunit